MSRLFYFLIIILYMDYVNGDRGVNKINFQKFSYITPSYRR